MYPKAIRIDDFAGNAVASGNNSNISTKNNNSGTNSTVPLGGGHHITGLPGFPWNEMQVTGILYEADTRIYYEIELHLNVLLIFHFSSTII